MVGAIYTSSCSWCGTAIEREDGWRAQEMPGRAAGGLLPPRARGAVADSGARTGRRGRSRSRAASTDSIDTCAHCGEPLGDVQVVLVRHRGEHRIPDAFCSADHMAEWAKAGGRWA